MSQMHSFIAKIFGRESADNIAAPTAYVEKQLEIYQPLLDLQDKRQLVRVEVLDGQYSIGQQSQSYQSMIVRIDFSHRELYLDALTPIDPYCPIVTGNTLAVSHHEFGKILSFQGKLRRLVTQNNELYYVITLPDDVGYKQRRFYPRLPINNLGMIKMRLWSPSRIPWHGRVRNISAGGARIAVGGNVASQIEKGCILPNCDIELETGQHLCCQARVKASRFLRRPYEHTEISVEFNNLGFQQRNWLLQWVDFHLRKHPLCATSAQ